MREYSQGPTIIGHMPPIMTQHYAHHYLESLRGGVKIVESAHTH